MLSLVFRHPVNVTTVRGKEEQMNSSHVKEEQVNSLQPSSQDIDIEMDDLSADDFGDL